jgi:carbonic anhydrase
VRGYDARATDRPLRRTPCPSPTNCSRTTPATPRASPAAEAFDDLDADVRQSVARIRANPFVPRTDAVRGFVFDVATGRLNEVK